MERHIHLDQVRHTLHIASSESLASIGQEIPDEFKISVDRTVMLAQLATLDIHRASVGSREMACSILLQRIGKMLAKNGLYVCHGRYRPKETAKREVGDSSEMLCLAIVGGTKGDCDLTNMR